MCRRAFARRPDDGSGLRPRHSSRGAGRAAAPSRGRRRYSLLAMAAPWELTASAFERLLVRLDADPARAADAYEALRLALTRFFDWRGAHFPDECADETMNRLARRVDEGAAVADIRSFALGIARLVLLERARSPQVRQDELDEQRIGPAPRRSIANRSRACSSAWRRAWRRWRRTRGRSSSSTTRTSGGRKSIAASAWPPSSGSRPTRCAAARSGCGTGSSDASGRVRRSGPPTRNPRPVHFSRGDAAGDRRRAAAQRQTDDAP